MSQRKTERLFSLVQCLLATGRYLTAVQIRGAVPGYPESDEAFKRMFERDKEELRELGVPISTGTDGPGADDVGYRIDASAYELPDIALEPDESAVLGLAARVWRRASLAGAAAGALLKLAAAGVDVSAGGGTGVEPRLGTDEPAFPALWQAVRDGRPVTFDYQAAGRVDVRRRTLEPWGVAARRGHWYVAGHDRDRADVRVFRLSRVVGEVRPAGPAGSVQVPDGVNVAEMIFARAEPPEPKRVAVVAVREGAGYPLRRWASDIKPDRPGFDRMSIDFHDPEWLAGHLAPFGDDVVVIEPADARDAVIRRLKGVLA